MTKKVTLCPVPCLLQVKYSHTRVQGMVGKFPEDTLGQIHVINCFIYKLI